MIGARLLEFAIVIIMVIANEISMGVQLPEMIIMVIAFISQFPNIHKHNPFCCFFKPPPELYSKCYRNQE
jgi:hypothetical protein